ncbi:right-handed parallel beta-helix repeat-containing protein [Candidatus Bathyarchaeota archaeon]|nr:right-handed parallel beta-helix repeat-containing protein [Candidatus Bathyarchaeota archaeon]
MKAHILLILAVMALPLTTVGASTITYSEEVYGTLQAAVDAASPGDTLLLPEGLIEGPVTVDKPLTIIGVGEKSTLFTYDGPSVMTIRSGNVTVNKVLFLLCNTGILVEDTGAASIEDCFFVENAVGVDIREGTGHTIRGNLFINNVACGAILQNVKESIVEDNQFNFSQPSEWPDIENLLGSVSGTGRFGLKLLGSGNLTITGNTFHDIGDCIYVGNSRSCVIAGNRFHASTVGLSIRDSTYNVVEDNEGYETEELMLLWLSSFNNVTGNTNHDGILSRDVESDNIYLLNGVNLTGRNFILETFKPGLEASVWPLSEALNITLFPDPVTESAWATVRVNTSEIHEDAIPGSLGFYDASGQIICQATVSNHSAVIEYSVEDRAMLFFAKKVDDEAPHASAGTDITSIINEAVSFDASASWDNFGIMEYRWSFGDGVTSVGENTVHAYSETGVYSVKLMVFDVAGNLGEDTITVTVLTDEETGEKTNINFWFILAVGTIILSIGAYFIYTRITK